jgi:hypothetical protein
MRCRKQILGALLLGLVWTLTATDVEAGDPSKKAKKKSEKILEKCQGLKRGDHVELEAIAEAPPASAGAPEHATSE